MLLVVGIELKSRREQCIRYIGTQPAQLAARRVLRDDLEIDIFGHTFDETVRAAQRRAAAEHEAELTCVNGGNRGERLDDVPILLDQRRPR
jgi:hypothetical protein